VDASENGASLAPALDLRSPYHGSSQAPLSVSHDSDTPSHSLNTVTVPSMSISLSPPLRAAARSVYRDLWRASATTFAGAVGLFLNNIVTYLYFLTRKATHPCF
jgi:hypothetical protein